MNQINVYNVELWLKENKKTFLNYIEQTECRKWSKWLADNSIHVFPCACSTRNKECIFIEGYFEVYKIYSLRSRYSDICEASKQYYKIKDNRKAVFEWVKYYEELGKKTLHIKPQIKITISSEPYQVEVINIPKNEFENILEFNKIFSEYYYSEDYENY